jgi:hypothetical protein
MGCDIHAYIDYSTPNNAPDRCSGFGRVDIDRNYKLFGVLAGVRGGALPFIPPRGMPEVYSWQVQQDYLMYIVPIDGLVEGVVSAAKAKEWVESGRSKYCLDGKFVTEPDFHTHSWLTTTEVAEVIKIYRSTTELEFTMQTRTVMNAILGAMKGLEKTKGYSARLVFWFDN